ncbi:hypothetical protein DVA76_18910, partial [Acinetobacter baumannii]
VPVCLFMHMMMHMCAQVHDIIHIPANGATLVHQETQWPSKGREEEDLLLVNMDINNAGFKLLRKTGFVSVFLGGKCIR